MDTEVAARAVRGIVAGLARSPTVDIPLDRGRGALGIDSLDLLEIVIECEDAFGLRIPDGVVTRFFTVGDVVAYVASAAATP